MALRHDLITLLADGKFHSGEELGESLALTRSAIWKGIQQLAQLGISLHRIKGRGYQIPGGLEQLDLKKIQSYFSDSFAKCCNLLLEKELESTNQYLLNDRARLPSGTVLLAEYQSKGRGRRQRSWFSPFGANLYCSVLWKFNKDPSELAGLSLAAGVAMVNALERYGIPQLRLKWPNDLLWHHRKLGGTLIEMTAEPHSQTDIVIGVGINLRMPSSVQIDQDWIDVATVINEKPNRNQLAAYLIEELIEMLQKFDREGFSPFIRAWQSLDAYDNQPVTIITTKSEIAGIAKGISSTGEFIMETENQEQIKFLNGDVTLRLQKQ